jgi:dihydrofolate reductase
MRKLIFSLNLSLDGVADHRVALADDELHEFSTHLLETVDTILFGRVTYQLMESYWPVAHQDPQATRSILAFADQINLMPKVVFSKTVQSAGWNNTRLVKGDAVQEVLKMKQGNGGPLTLGGIRLIQTFMKLKLIDEYWLLVHPVIWGAGRRLFDGVDDRLELKLVDSQTFKSGVVVLHYMPTAHPPIGV